jgi:hypothetical protein
VGYYNPLNDQWWFQALPIGRQCQLLATSHRHEARLRPSYVVVHVSIWQQR